MRSPTASPAPREPAYRQPSYGPAQADHHGSPYAGARQSPHSGWPAQDRVPAPASQSPITNNAGFDFTSGYARPQTQNFDRRPSEGAKSTAQEAYPGYKAYQPPSS